MKAGYIAIVGKPNVGKSTLLNQLIGDKVSIISNKAQTTQRNVIAVLDRPEFQMAFVDTPGIHQEKKFRFYRHLNDVAQSGCDGVDAILYLCDVKGWTHADAYAWKSCNHSDVPIVVAVNKIDKIHPKERLLGYLSEIQAKCPGSEIVPISAIKNKNLDKLINVIYKKIPAQPKLFSDYDSMSMDDTHVLELIREKIFRLTAQEIPYESILLMRHHEKRANVRHIYVDICVKKQGQKLILLGGAGHGLKRVGMAARQDLEKFFGEKVCLKLWVKLASQHALEQMVQEQPTYVFSPGRARDAKDCADA